MKIVQLGKGEGKTTDMLVWLLEGQVKGIDRALIVATQQELVRLREQIKQLYKVHGEPKYMLHAGNRLYTVEAVRKMRGGMLRNCEIGIDDADVILSILLGLHRRPSIISVTDLPSGSDRPENIFSV